MELSLDPGEPKTLQEGLSGRDTELWKDVLAAEIMNFLSRDAWLKVPMKQVKDEGWKLVDTKLVFKIKEEQNGNKRYKVQIVMKGFLMIPRVDYTESFSPVSTEVGN